MTFDFESLKDILVCPETRAPLVHDGQRLVSTSPRRRLSYSIQDDIPIMLVDEATELSSEEWSDIMQRHGRHPETGETAADSDAGGNNA